MDEAETYIRYYNASLMEAAAFWSLSITAIPPRVVLTYLSSSTTQGARQTCVAALQQLGCHRRSSAFKWQFFLSYRTLRATTHSARIARSPAGDENANSTFKVRSTSTPSYLRLLIQTIENTAATSDRPLRRCVNLSRRQHLRSALTDALLRLFGTHYTVSQKNKTLNTPSFLWPTSRSCTFHFILYAVSPRHCHPFLKHAHTVSIYLLHH